jgi:hypothetical protein
MQVELKAVALPADTPLARLHRSWRRQQQQQQASKRQQERRGGEGSAGYGEAATPAAAAGAAAIPPSALLGQGPLAFQLKTQAVCLAGWDLPAVLPDVAALLQPILLPSLVEDVEAALEHAERHLAAARRGSCGPTAAAGREGDGSPLMAAARAARWALKRCIRAAFELYLCAPGDGAYSSSGSSAGGGSGVDAGATAAAAAATRGDVHGGKVYTRDLYWCMRYASLRYTDLAAPLEAGLRLYLRLGMLLESSTGGTSISRWNSTGSDCSSSSSHSSSSGTGSSSSEGQVEEVEAAMRLADGLAQAVDAFFLDQMLAEEAGWLDSHDWMESQPGSPQPALAIKQPQEPRMQAASAQRASRQTPGDQAAQRHGAPGFGAASQLPADGRSSPQSFPRLGDSGWAQRLRVRLWAGVAALGGGMEARLVGRPPPPVRALPVAGDVLTLDWAQPEARLQAERIIAAALQPGRSGCADLGGGSGGDAAARPQPVLLKGAAGHWPAVQRWSLAYLAASGLEGRTRLAPSLHFPFTEPTLAAVAARRGGVAALPSCVAAMPAAELAARLQAGNPCRLAPLVYGGAAAQPDSACELSFGQEAAFLGESWGSKAAASTASSAASWQLPEWYYFQGDLPPRLLRDIDLSAPPFQPPPEAGGRRRRQSQAARVWVSPRGAVSPTHYDWAHSFLTQIRGR